MSKKKKKRKLSASQRHAKAMKKYYQDVNKSVKRLLRKEEQLKKKLGI